MTFGKCVYQTIIYPLELIYELIYALVMKYIPIPGVAIIIISMFINIMLIPIYQMIDRIQKDQQMKEKEILYWTKHIKKTFKGDERFFMLKTYYRQKNYHPIYALKGALPLLLEFPFFIAAYHFLSNLPQLNGVPFLFLKNLGNPDELITVFGISINIMPIIMTVINLISSIVYTKEMSGKDKIQMYVMALIFLVLLYNSPSGLVLYWTLNNIFTLVKNIIFLRKRNTINDYLISSNKKSNMIIDFFICELVLIVLLGIVIPSGVIKASPLEFVDITDRNNPVYFLIGSTAIAFGYFGLWLPFFFFLSKEKREKIVLYICLFLYVAIIDYFFFATDLGYISANLKYNDGLNFSIKEIVINVIILIILMAILFYIYIHKFKILTLINTVSLVVLLVISIINISSITYEYRKADFSETVGEDINIPLSKTGKNVIVFMLDRALSGCVPYIMNEKPELKSQFSGFVYYPNTISYGTNTSAASAAVFGGYEYVDVNRLDDETRDRRNEALKLMPEIFSNEGYEVTIFDPPFANGQEIPDLSIYEDLPVRAFHASGTFHYQYGNSNNSERRYRNFFCYSLCKSMPLVAQYTLYDDGYYNDVTVYFTDSVFSYLNENDEISKGTSFNYTFEKEFSELSSLPEITVVEDNNNTFFMGYNLAPHEPTILHEPDYVPLLYVDNTEYDAENTERFTLNGRTMNINNSSQMYHYQVNMATFIQLGKWFDFLRENDVYDNTKIILVADHGWSVGHFDDMITDDGMDIEGVNPLLMVKDFNSKDYIIDESFMTNADVPYIAFDSIIESPVNPYSGKKIDAMEKNNHYHKINGIGYEVKNDIFILDNWKKID